MKNRQTLSAALMAALLLATLPGLALASTQTIGPITFTTPDTHASCSDQTTFDTITATGVPAGWTLKGQVIVDYVLDGGGRQMVATYPVNQQGNLSLTVSYPPVSQWPVQSNGTREIHVDVQIEVFNQIGELVATLGPGQDWDVFCLDNPPPPPGGQGCTPGYWKQSQHFDSWPAAYSPSTSFESVFGRDVPGNPTLLDALGLGGGGLKALMRHAAAALLNSASVNYGLTTGQVITKFQAAYDSKDYETTKNLFDTLNNKGCPLN